MGKKAKKKDEKNLKREQEAAARQAAMEAAAKRQRLMRMLLIADPIVTLAVALPVWLLLDSPRAAALVGLVGVAVWIPLLLGSIGGEIEPRDRTRAGSIDFGNSRDRR